MGASLALSLWVAATWNFANYGGAGDAVTNALGATGTDNTPALAALVLSTGTNDTIYFPPGRYLLIPPFMKTNGVMSNAYQTGAALTLKRGGLTFLGSNATLQLPGAYQLQPYVQRGILFSFTGSITNDYPVVFDGLTFDGGTYPGFTTNHFFPASETDGSGWDVTHAAVIDQGNNLNSLKVFRNCRFAHWRGEIVKSVSTWVGGFNQFTNCVFEDGNASGINFTFAHRVSDSRFDTLYLGMEFYQGYTTTNCVFERSTFTNISGNGIVIVGALANHDEPNYLIISNTISGSVGGILGSPAANLTIVSNRFTDCTFGVYASSAAYQGTDHCHDWEVAYNRFEEATFQPLGLNGAGNDWMERIQFHHNTAGSATYTIFGYGSFSNVTTWANVSGNVMAKSDYITGDGDWVLDDLSNAASWHLESGDTLYYYWGARQKVSGGNWKIHDDAPYRIPPGAKMAVWNAGATAHLWTSSSNYPNCYTTSIANGQTKYFEWVGSSWQPADRIDAAQVTIGTLRGR